MKNVVATRQAEFLHDGFSMVAVEISSGQIELYRVDADGIEMFYGYLTDPRVSGAARLAACEALYSTRPLSVYSPGAHLTFARARQLEETFSGEFGPVVWFDAPTSSEVDNKA